ncbi:MAG: hypothetical protein JW701_00550 [Kosmotogaceae bacterium]|nr:hypothetical protein [Kosmotogaceae bacterium]
MESYTLFDEALSPSSVIVINYKGENPFRLYGEITKMMQIVYHGRGKNIFEKSFKWDITSDPREFSFDVWFDDAKFDNRTRPLIRVRCHGQQPSDPKSPNGICKIEIKPLIRTEYKFKHPLEKQIAMSIIWLYHRLIYNDVRRRYMQILREQTFDLERRIRELYNMPLEQPELSGGPPRLYANV